MVFLKSDSYVALDCEYYCEIYLAQYSFIECNHSRLRKKVDKFKKNYVTKLNIKNINLFLCMSIRIEGSGKLCQLNNEILLAIQQEIINDKYITLK